MMGPDGLMEASHTRSTWECFPFSRAQAYTKINLLLTGSCHGALAESLVQYKMVCFPRFPSVYGKGKHTENLEPSVSLIWKTAELNGQAPKLLTRAGVSKRLRRGRSARSWHTHIWTQPQPTKSGPRRSLAVVQQGS